MSVGQIFNLASSGIIYFLAARTDRGHLNDSIVPQQEPLTTPGVDGVRWRLVFNQYERTELYTVVDATNFADAIKKKKLAEEFNGALCRVDLVSNSVEYTNRNVHVEAVRATIFPGPAVGEGATGTAHLVILFSLMPTEF